MSSPVEKQKKTPLVQVIPFLAVILIAGAVIVSVLVSKNSQQQADQSSGQPASASSSAAVEAPQAVTGDEGNSASASGGDPSASATASGAAAGDAGAAAMVLLKNINLTPDNAKFTADVIPTKAPNTLDGFDPAKYPNWATGEKAATYHWADLPSPTCDTRQAALYRDGQNVSADPKTCEITAGTWVDPYTGQTITDPAQMTAVNIVSPQNSYANGGKDWNEEQRSIFTNMPENVIAASVSSAKNNAGANPSTWQPKEDPTKCAYGIRWVAVKNKVGLNFSDAESAGVKDQLLAACDSSGS